ncbi:hypothetical protein N0V91_006422 [Didymella pomorum]|jgi:hypothetical protein|uniref:Fungal N-terminal domain-containing protein n=1 Tax=Didymella pomorum TaxID=749634 RepID=A0A9W9D690_9PLEO|nr:hypothetical protein N0V91_006422 [Didymella pomorum]
MAELLGLVASVIQVAGAGIQLSKTLYGYVDGVATADHRIKDIATEIKMTSIVIEELGDVFKHKETASLVSKKAVQMANDTITECSALFAQIDATLKKSRKNTLGRLALPFRDTKLELLRSHVDKLKSTLQLLMQVLTHAYQVASRKLDRAAEDRQREEIKRLLEKKDESTRRHEELLRRDSGSENSTLVDDADKGDVGNGDTADSEVSVAAIDSTITADNLATCVDHVRNLLRDIEALQKTLAAASPGDNHSAQQQKLINSYFVSRSHLDGVILGSSTGNSIVRQTSTKARRVEVVLNHLEETQNMAMLSKGNGKDAEQAQLDAPNSKDNPSGMSPMNARFKNLVGSKRKSSSHKPLSEHALSGPSISTPEGSNRPTSLSPPPMNPQNTSLRPLSNTLVPQQSDPALQIGLADVEVSDDDPVNEQMRLLMLRGTRPNADANASTFRIDIPVLLEDLEDRDWSGQQKLVNMDSSPKLISSSASPMRIPDEVDKLLQEWTVVLD